MLSPETCARLIRMSRERTFSLDLEHVDDKPLYQIDLVQNGWVSDLPCNVRREGGQSLVVGGPSLVILEGNECNPL